MVSIGGLVRWVNIEGNVMFVVEDIEQHAILGHVMVLSMKIVDREALPINSYLSESGDRTPNKVQLIKTLRQQAGTSLRDGKRIIELLLTGIELKVKMSVKATLLQDFISEFKRIGIEVRCVNTNPIDHEEYQEALVSMLPQMPQRQDSLSEQLQDLVAVARKLGMYDAADVVYDNLIRRRR